MIHADSNDRRDVLRIRDAGDGRRPPIDVRGDDRPRHLVVSVVVLIGDTFTSFRRLRFARDLFIHVDGSEEVK